MYCLRRSEQVSKNLNYLHKDKSKCMPILLINLHNKTSKEIDETLDEV